MTYATPADHPNILQLFKTYKSVFPYLRADYLTRKITAGQVIWDNGVVIIFNTYKVNRRLGSKLTGVLIHKGDIMLSEMASTTQGSGIAGRILDDFIHEHPTQYIWLTVRTDNERACRFYERHGMTFAGALFWAQETIPGCIYRIPPQGY